MKGGETVVVLPGLHPKHARQIAGEDRVAFQCVLDRVDGGIREPACAVTLRRADRGKVLAGEDVRHAAGSLPDGLRRLAAGNVVFVAYTGRADQTQRSTGADVSGEQIDLVVRKAFQCGQNDEPIPFEVVESGPVGMDLRVIENQNV